MIAELGQFALILAFCFAVLQSLLPLIGVQQKNSILASYGPTLATGQFLFLILSFGFLTLCFLQDDFSVAYVAKQSNSLLPIQYKISAVWGGHEGSILLWVLMLAGWTFAVALIEKDMPLEMKARIISVLGIVSVGFLLFIMLTSNPFDRLLPSAPMDGNDLNPLLQDFGLIVHPPTLYMGYVGFSVSFAFAIAALLGGQLDSAWTKWVRPWTNAAWAFLTVGIALGSWWAYYELGWGGWWFWDPVENASLLPWLVGTALIHSLAVTEKRGSFKSWTLLLAIMAFSLSLLGTFLVRSGVLTSVHAFANDPERGMFILALLGICVGISLFLYAIRTHLIRSVGEFEIVSRETFLLLNNILMVAMTLVVLIGTLYPLVIDAMGMGKLSIGPPYFNTLFVPLSLILMGFVGLGAMARWKKQPINLYKNKAVIALAAAIGLGVLWTISFDGPWNWSVFVGLSFSVWVLALTALDLVDKLRNKSNKWQAFLKMSGSYKGMLLAHSGIAVCAIGVSVVSNYSVEKDIKMAPGDVLEVYDYRFEFVGAEGKQGPNYVANVGRFKFYDDDQFKYYLLPEKRRYNSGGNIMTEADIDAGFFKDIYVAMGEPLENGAWAVRIHFKPMVRWIWLGSLMMALGGVWAMADKRYRKVKNNKDNQHQVPEAIS